jgi:uncharacterized damage-inducible protein DinB
MDKTKDNHEGGTWTIKIKHTFTIYRDKTSIRGPDNKTFGQIISTIDKSSTITDDIEANESIKDVVTTPDHTFIAGIRVNAEPTLSSNDISEETEPSYENPLYEEIERRRSETADSNQNARDEQETLMAAEERRNIMERYPRSGFLVHDIMEHENYHKGYRFYSGVSLLLS